MAVDFFDDVAPKIDGAQEYILIDRSKEIAKIARGPVTHKTCKMCSQDREIKYFSVLAGKYFASYCLDCVRKVSRREYNNNKQKRIVEINNWQKENKEKIVQYNRGYWETRRRIKKKIGRRGRPSAASAN